MLTGEQDELRNATRSKTVGIRILFQTLTTTADFANFIFVSPYHLPNAGFVC
jgi:hypothetical protein